VPAPESDRALVERLDRLPLTRLHLLVVALSALGFGFDLLEIALGSALSAVFSAPPHAVGAGPLALLLSSVYAGAVLGAPLLGRLADRHGRRTVLVIALLFLAATSLGAACSPQIGRLTVFRALSGLSLGAYPPLMIAYLTDLLPPRHRGRWILIAVAFASLGSVAALFFIRWLTPVAPLDLAAWRWAFLLGSTGAALVGVLFTRLPESPRWLMARGRPEEAAAVLAAFQRSARGPAAEPPAAAATARAASAPPPRARNALLAALYFLSPWPTVGFSVLSGAVLVAKGFVLTDSLLYVGVTNFGPVVGTALAALVVDRVQRRSVLLASAAVMVATGLVFAASGSPGWLMVSGLTFLLFASLYIPALSIYAAESVPTATRASLTAGFWALNRVGSALVPLTLLPLMKRAGTAAMFAVITGALVAGMVLVAAFGPPGQAGKPVE
jgi:putative MFS transporter